MYSAEHDLPYLLAEDLDRYFSDLVTCFQQRLFGFALRLTSSPSDAEDIVQEALISAFVGYWFWGNLLALPALPTVNGTLLTANGDYMLVGYFGGDGTNVHHATAQQVTQSLLLLLALGGVALIAAWHYQRWEKARQ